MESKRSIREANLAVLVNRGLTVTNALELQRVARKLHRLDELRCNVGVSSRQETREARLERDASDIAGTGGLRVYRQGDPRGWPLYVYKQAHLDDCKPYSIDVIYTQVGQAVCPF